MSRRRVARTESFFLCSTTRRGNATYYEPSLSLASMCALPHSPLSLSLYTIHACICSGLFNVTDSAGECGVPYEKRFAMPTPAPDQPWSVHLSLFFLCTNAVIHNATSSCVRQCFKCMGIICHTTKLYMKQCRRLVYCIAWPIIYTHSLKLHKKVAQFKILLAPHFISCVMSCGA